MWTASTMDYMPALMAVEAAVSALAALWSALRYPAGLPLYGTMTVMWCLLLFLSRWKHRRFFGGWQFRPNVRRVMEDARCVSVDESCLEQKPVLFASAAPAEPLPGLNLRAHSSSLLLATAAALTGDGLDAFLRPAVDDALSALGMQPDRVAKRWPLAGTDTVAGLPAVIVRDGGGLRFFLCTEDPSCAPTPTHLFEEKETPLAAHEWPQLLNYAASWQEAQGCRRAVHYFTGRWMETGPESIAYLGCIAFGTEPTEASLHALERLHRTGLAPAGDREQTLLITAADDPLAPLQMCCADADPVLFADVLPRLRAKWDCRRSLITLVCLWGLAALFAGALIPEVNEVFPMAALSVVLPLLMARLRDWEFRTPDGVKASLFAVAACLLAPLVYLPAAEPLGYSAAACAALCSLLTATWGIALSLLARQKRALLWSLTAVLLWAAAIVLTALVTAPLPAAFGAVLGALLQLPLWYLKVR